MVDSVVLQNQAAMGPNIQLVIDFCADIAGYWPQPFLSSAGAGLGGQETLISANPSVSLMFLQSHLGKIGKSGKPCAKVGKEALIYAY